MPNTITTIIKIMINKIKIVFNSIFKIRGLLYFMIFIFGFIIFLIINLKVTAAQTNNNKNENKCVPIEYKDKGCVYACKQPDGSIYCGYGSPVDVIGGGATASTQSETYVGAVCTEEGGKIICSGGEKASSETQIVNALGQEIKIKDGKIVDSSFSLTRIAASVIGFVAFVINYIISIILGVVINLEAWLVEIALAMNDQILKSDFVQSGYQISLAVTNLIFVAGIIVAAIATILRWESYSMKKILWHLILMAILVNFGLSIAGAIIRVSTNFSWYFLNAVNPGGGTGAAHYGAFATAIAGAFTPQRFFITDISKNGATTTPEGSKNVTGQITQEDQNTLAGMFGASLAQILTPVVSIFFTIAFLVVIIITLGALVVMLINRYIRISFLLMLLPLAWALWVFPNTKKYWTEWWDSFIRWTFFAPAVLFFLYLCLLTLRATPGGGNAGVHIQGVNFTFDQKGALGGLQSFGGSFIMNLIVPILNAIVMTGCAIGSLTVANKLGIEGAKKAEGIARGAAKSVGMFAANRAAGLGAAGLTKILPKTPPKTTTGIKGRLGKAWFGVSQQAERFGITQKLEETSKKYGPSTWPYLPKNFKQRRKQVGEIKAEIDKINEELKDIPSAINRRQEEIQRLEQQLNSIKLKYNPDLQKLQNAISKIQSQIKTETDHIKLGQLSQQKQALEAEQNKIMQQMNEETKPVSDQISKIQGELEDLSGTLMARRREKYQQIRDLKPEGIFGTIINAGMEAYKPKKKKVKAPKEKVEKMSEEVKEQIEDLGIELEAEEEKTNQQQKNQNQQSQTKKV